MSTRVRLRWVVAWLGIAQIISWGTLYYSIAVLGESMRADLGVGRTTLFAAFTLSLLASGAVSPAVGRWIDRRGGRRPLAWGSVLGALALATLAMSVHPAMMFAGWLLAGLSMAATLYDPAFATLHQLSGAGYRRAVTALTLFGGFASTVFWPVASVLLEAYGWRNALWCFAALHVAVCLPIHWLVLPDIQGNAAAPKEKKEEAKRDKLPAAFFWLGATFAIASFVSGALSAHLIELLKMRGLPGPQAVWIAACIGPMQVAGRVIEFALAGRSRASQVGYAAFGMLVIGMLALILAGPHLALALAFAVFYGMSNGVFTIVRGIAPAEFLHGRGMGATLGGLAAPQFAARAFSPVVFAALLGAGLTAPFDAVVLTVLALAALACFYAAARSSATSS